MLVTEKEAGGKWCQETFGSARVRCVASECMAWRWGEDVPHVCTKCGTEETAWEDQPELRKGYCGMAGVAKW